MHEGSIFKMWETKFTHRLENTVDTEAIYTSVFSLKIICYVVIH